WGVAYANSGFVFTAEDGAPLHADHVANRFERLVAGAQVPGIRFHDLRHTHATLLLKAGVPVHVVAQRLGHASPALTLSIYSHVLPRQQSEAAAEFAKLIDGSDGGQQADDEPSAAFPAWGYESIGWTAAIHGGPAAHSDDGEWLAADFDGAATAANLELSCNQCGWSKTVAAGEWEAR